MSIRCSIALFFMGLTFTAAQEKKSKGDAYFFQYAYEQAIAAYEKDIAKGYQLSSQQYLNLADSYFNQKDFEKAKTYFMDVFTNDSIMGNHHFNKMLQSLSKTSGNEQVNAFLNTKKTQLSSELIENSEFNQDVLHSASDLEEIEFRVFNLESNSPQSDFSPAFFNDQLLFTSGRPLGKKKSYIPSGETYLDLFSGKIDEVGQVGSTGMFIHVKQSNFHKATPFFSKKLNGVFYVLSNAIDGKLEFDDNGKNTLAIGFQKLNGDFQYLWKDLSTSFYYPFFEPESERLYFVAELEGGYGGTDIYYVNTNAGQIMSAPVNLGPRINSPGNEIAPYFYDNSLYFSSDVFYGMGGMDVYKSNLDVENRITIPINLGAQINSNKDDFGFIIRDHGEGLLGYFSSNREGGKGGDDIYGFMVDEKPGIKTLALYGKVIQPINNSPVERAIVRLKDAQGQVLKEVVTNEEGDYRVEVPWQEEATLEVVKARFSVFSQTYSEMALEQLQEMPSNIGLTDYKDIVEEKEGQTVIKLRSFYFDRGKSKITPSIAIELDKVVEAVKLFPEVQLRIETYTDSRGGSATNFRLTQARSDAIKNYLVSHGVAASAIPYAVGFGEKNILNNCKNGVYCLEMLHRQNQRSLIVVLNDNLLFE